MIKVFELVDPSVNNCRLFRRKSHLVLIKNGDAVYRNPYSLISSRSTRAPTRMQLLLKPTGRGGSQTLHTRVREGDQLEITNPRTSSHWIGMPKKHVLIAGGWALRRARAPG